MHPEVQTTSAWGWPTCLDPRELSTMKPKMFHSAHSHYLVLLPADVDLTLASDPRTSVDPSGDLEILCLGIR